MSVSLQEIIKGSRVIRGHRTRFRDGLVGPEESDPKRVPVTNLGFGLPVVQLFNRLLADAPLRVVVWLLLANLANLPDRDLEMSGQVRGCGKDPLAAVAAETPTAEVDILDMAPASKSEDGYGTKVCRERPMRILT